MVFGKLWIRSLVALAVIPPAAFPFIAARDEKIQYGFFGGIQLSSTKFNACLIVKSYFKKNIFYLGAKNPVSSNNIYGYFPVGFIGGYGYKLLVNENWEMATLLDIQWLCSKTQNQIKPTHYFDFTLNYQLSYIKWKKIQLNSSFGYGFFYKYYYTKFFNGWKNTHGISGLISLGIDYVI